MATLFGHTQTLTSISKSVTAVAGGILGLQDNLANFMKKVIFFDKFFQRMRPNLPPDLVATATLLFARCYEYRDEIRDELESSLAYVADAGRWVIGMEDWNSKMEKRLQQINELVLLANSMLMEYAITGKVGADGSMDELDAYLQIFSASIVLKQGKKSDAKVIDRPLGSSKSVQPPQEQQTTVKSTFQAIVDEIGMAASKIIADPATDSAGQPSLFGPPVVSTKTQQVSSARRIETDQYTSIPDAGFSSAVEDDETLNPFANCYQQPYGNSSMMSSVYSVTSEASELAGGKVVVCNGHSTDGVNAQPDSPVSLGEYECLDLDAIPNYMAFKSSALKTRQQRSKVSHGSFTQADMNRSVASITSDVSDGVASSESESNTARSRYDELFSLPDLRSRQQAPVMDLTYSYDLQRETQFNPFVTGEAVLPTKEVEISSDTPPLAATVLHGESVPYANKGLDMQQGSTADAGNESDRSDFAASKKGTTENVVATSLVSEYPQVFEEIPSTAEIETKVTTDFTRAVDESAGISGTVSSPVPASQSNDVTSSQESNLFG